MLVRKKEESYRFCVDYRKLNQVTKQDSHPLPRVDDLLDAFNRYKLFSALDLRSGYWQVSLNPQDMEKTAFIAPVFLNLSECHLVSLQLQPPFPGQLV